MNLETNFQAIEVKGQDNFKFLQSQITADLNLLNNQDNKYILSAYCNQKGRVITVFYIFKQDNNYILLFLGDTSEIFLKKIKKYAIFSKISFEEYNNKNLINLITNQDDFLRFLINNKIPIINQYSSEQFLPDNLNLLDLNAVSFKKGCFLGQEIIARVYYKGKTKKKLVTIKLDSSNIPDKIKLTPALYPIYININNNQQNIGDILFYNHDINLGLAVITTEYLDNNLSTPAFIDNNNNKIIIL